MTKYYSMRMNLEDVISDRDKELVILENIRRCNNLVGKFFKVVFWYKNLNQQECNNFLARNEKLLSNLNVKITKRFENVWFLIDSAEDKCSGRYRFEGDILEGIVQYLQIIGHIKKRDGSNQ